MYSTLMAGFLMVGAVFSRVSRDCVIINVNTREVFEDWRLG